MKKRLLIGLLILLGLNNITTAQEYVEGEVLVKFRTRSSVQMRAPRLQAFRSSQNNAMDSLFMELGVDSVEQLMPRTGHTNVGKKLRAYNGSIVEVKDLSKLYRLTLRPEKSHTIRQAIERLQQMDDVEFAEPNYIVYAQALPYDTIIPTQDSATYVSEPLYSQQWGLPAINLPQLWNKPKVTSKRPVIAILDTGVDIEHPDLAANIWTNPAEANGVPGLDDDNNGFPDDLHGWDFVNTTGEIADFNGHGTHCAGIAAAVGNNGIGITGANPDALIMPVAVLQKDGKGNTATIIRGIDYAAANGADVISMSLGGDAYSAAEEQALIRAYSSAILVAAAGNDHMSINEELCYPAAFPMVLGVEASQNAEGDLASFSNFDEDGPVYTDYSDKLYNYELRAPGVEILSTFPGGRYKVLQGTSMACPMAAGAISRLMQCKAIPNKELLFGDLVHTRTNGNGNIDILSSFDIIDADRYPELLMISYCIDDSLVGDGDGRADAGETIGIYPILQNAWGTATNIRYWFKQGMDVNGHWVYGDTSRITLLQDTTYFGKPLSSYAHAKAANSFQMSVSPDCPDGFGAYLTLFAVCDNTLDTFQQIIHLKVENGVEIGGMVTDTLVLYPNVHYVVTRNLAITENALLVIKPGTRLEFCDGVFLSNAGRIYAEGTPDSMITFTKTDTGTGWGGLYLNADDTLGYCVIEYTANNTLITGKRLSLGWSSCDRYGFEKLQSAIVHDAIIRNNFHLNTVGRQFLYCIKLSNSNIYNNVFPGYYLFDNIFRGSGWDFNFDPCTTSKNDRFFQKNNFIKNSGKYNEWEIGDRGYIPVIMQQEYYTPPFLYSDFLHGNWYDNDFSRWGINIGTITSNVWDVSLGSEFYMGSAREDIVRQHIYDFEYPGSTTSGRINLDNMARRPMADTHGVVWKVVVNGYDAQDEFDSIPPLGVGTHRCDVYFNRPMNVSIAPTITYGIREPYEQHTVAENGTWSADSTYYTAYFTIDAKTMSDGLNTFKVTGAQDPEHFEIPTEDTRFHMEIAAAGSMSTGLTAEAGLGKVTITWESDENGFDDLLGYNVYRWVEDTIWGSTGEWYFDTICINQSLIDAQDSMYVDYNVVPGTSYYYLLREISTALASYDVSNPVTATPLTSIKGDANGTMTVNVADILTELSYILEENPQPFIFEAADVNSDNLVNIYDVVGTVNLILHPENIQAASINSPAYYSVENGILYVETDVVLGGVQATLMAEPGSAIESLSALDEFERIGQWQDSTHFIFIAYSMSGKTLGIGRHALLNIGEAEVQSIVLSDTQGHEVAAVPLVSTALDGTPFIPGSRKYIQNGHLYIQIGDRIYSSTGLLIH